MLRSYADTPFRAIISKSDLGGVELSADQQQQLVSIVHIVAQALSVRIKLELVDLQWPDFINLDAVIEDRIYLALNYTTYYV